MAQIIYKVYYTDDTDRYDKEYVVGYFTESISAEHLKAATKGCKIEKIVAYDSVTEEKEIKDNMNGKLTPLERAVLYGN